LKPDLWERLLAKEVFPTPGVPVMSMILPKFVI
jgi:hypothetical protein